MLTKVWQVVTVKISELHNHPEIVEMQALRNACNMSPDDGKSTKKAKLGDASESEEAAAMETSQLNPQDSDMLQLTTAFRCQVKRLASQIIDETDFPPERALFQRFCPVAVAMATDLCKMHMVAWAKHDAGLLV